MFVWLWLCFCFVGDPWAGPGHLSEVRAKGARAASCSTDNIFGNRKLIKGNCKLKTVAYNLSFHVMGSLGRAPALV